jgi:hypothetical protein
VVKKGERKYQSLIKTFLPHLMRCIIASIQVFSSYNFLSHFFKNNNNGGGVCRCKTQEQHL